jgi:hypothetical protein
MVWWWRREKLRRVGLKSGQSSWTKAFDFFRANVLAPKAPPSPCPNSLPHVCPAQAPIKNSYSVSTQIKLNHSRRARASREREKKSAAQPGLHHTVAAVAREIFQISPETRRIAPNLELHCPARRVPVGSGPKCAAFFEIC